MGYRGSKSDYKIIVCPGANSRVKSAVAASTQPQPLVRGWGVWGDSGNIKLLIIN